MTKRSLPTPEELRQLLRYEPETGKLYWKERPPEMFANRNAYATWNARYSGTEAFTSTVKEGYKTGSIFNKKHYAHRVAWAIHNNEWPLNMIDHVNGDRPDNRVENLREATGSENNFNSRVRCDSASGLKGAMYSTRDGTWSSRISVNGQVHRLGTFSTPEDAHAAYCEAAKKYHGEFARTE